MTHYLLFFGSSYLDNRDYKWSELYRGNYDDCTEKFMSNIKVICLYPTDSGCQSQSDYKIELSNLKCSQLVRFDLSTDGQFLHVQALKESLESRPCHKCRMRSDSNNYQELISYQSPNDLDVCFSALLISKKTLIRYLF